MHHGRAHRSILSTGAAAASLLLAACVTSYEDVPPDEVPRTPIVIGELAPLDGGDSVVNQLYSSVLDRLQTAHKERDLETMQTQLATWLRDDAPSWARPGLLGFRALAAGLAFEQHAAHHGKLATASLPAVDASVPAGEVDTIGSALQFQLEVPPMASAAVRLGGVADDDPTAFQVEVRVRDYFVDGSRRDHSDAEIVRPEAAVELGAAPLQLPIALDLGASVAVRRDIDIRVDLMPGYVRCGDERAPVRRTTIAATVVTQWPKGHGEVRKAPLAALQAAQKNGDPQLFWQVRLAAEFAPPADRPAVERALVDWIRLGSPAQATVAMATLRALGAAEIPVGDRDAWLVWWQSRR